MTASEASRCFSAVLNSVAGGETIVVTRVGRRVALITQASHTNGVALREVFEHWRYNPALDDALASEVVAAPDTASSVSDLATRLGVPWSTLHREVVRLDEAGLITSRTQGRNRLVRANSAHPAVPALTQLLEVTFGPRVVIAEEFAGLGAEFVGRKLCGSVS